MKTIRSLFGSSDSSGIGQFGMIIALVLILGFFTIASGGTTLAPTNVINVFQQYSYILILAIGMVQVIVAGHIDLSVGSVAAFVGIVVTQAMAQFDAPIWAAILLGLGVGALAGAWNGFWVAFVKVPAFIVTLAGFLIFRGLNQLLGNSTSVPAPQEYQFIGNGFIPDFGPSTGYSNGTLLIGLVVAVVVVVREVQRRRQRARMGAEALPLWGSAVRVGLFLAVTAFITYEFAAGPIGTSVPVVALIMGALVLLYGFVTQNTVLGRRVYAVGGNANAAVLSGVSARAVNFYVMFNMSVLAAIAGMVFVAYSGASGPADGTGWELDAIAAVFVGGAAVAGGIGTVTGSIIGGLVMAFLANGLSLIGAPSETSQVVRGLVLLLAVAFDVYSKTQGRPSLIGRLMSSVEKPRFEEPKQRAARSSDSGADQPRSIEDQDRVTLP